MACPRREPTIDLDLTSQAKNLLSDTTFHAVFGAKREGEDDRTCALPIHAPAQHFTSMSTKEEERMEEAMVRNPTLYPIMFVQKEHLLTCKHGMDRGSVHQLGIELVMNHG